MSVCPLTPWPLMGTKLYDSARGAKTNKHTDRWTDAQTDAT